MSEMSKTRMSTEALKFNQVTSVKLPRSASYIYNNLVQHNDTLNNISYYAIINGFEVWIIKHCDPEKLTNHNKKEPLVQLRKVPYDRLESVSCVKWCKFGSFITFVIGTECGIIHVYDFDAKKILYSHDVSTDSKSKLKSKSKIKRNNNLFNPTINCIDCNDKNLLFIGLSSGDLLSFDIDDDGLSNKKIIFQCPNNESINCISRPLITNNNINKNNKIYIGCNDGSVIQYDFYSLDIDILIEKSNINKIIIDDDSNNNNNQNKINNEYNNCGSCICMASCDDFVVIGYSSGSIKIVQKSELSFVIKQIAMHRRMVTSISILEDQCLIASVSEDGYYHIIRNTSSSLDVIRSASFQNTILIGVEFVKSKHYSLYHHDQKYKDRIIIISAYDRNRVAFV